jgi:single-stranded DNA-binding protein
MVTDNSANHRINNLMERLAIGVLVILLGFVQTQYWSDKSEAKQEVKELNTKVLDLYRSSVTKQELKELETRLAAGNEAIRADVRQILTFYLERK